MRTLAKIGSAVMLLSCTAAYGQVALGGGDPSGGAAVKFIEHTPESKSKKTVKAERKTTSSATQDSDDNSAATTNGEVSSEQNSKKTETQQSN
jgi:hypothetical protein